MKKDALHLVRSLYQIVEVTMNVTECLYRVTYYRSHTGYFDCSTQFSIEMKKKVSESTRHCLLDEEFYGTAALVGLLAKRGAGVS